MSELVAPLKDNISALIGLQSALTTDEPRPAQLTRLELFLSRARTEAVINDADTYKQIRVRLHGKGAVLRCEVSGADVLTRPQFVARAGQLIMSRIDARNGAFAIVPPELDGGIVTQDFPLFHIDQSMVVAEYLALLLRSHSFVDLCQRASKGTTNRKRLREELFLSESLPLPHQASQLAIVRIALELRRVRDGLGEALARLDSAIPELANTLAS